MSSTNTTKLSIAVDSKSIKTANTDLEKFAKTVETFGRRIGSLTYHFDNFKNSLGAAFSPNIGASIDTLTGKLQNLNRVLNETRVSSDMERWGKNNKIGIDTTNTSIEGKAGQLTEAESKIDFAGSIFYWKEALAGAERYKGALNALGVAQNNINKLKSVGIGITALMGGKIGIIIAALTTLAVLGPKAYDALKSSTSKAVDGLKEMNKRLSKEHELLKARLMLLKEGKINTKDLSNEEIKKIANIKKEKEKITKEFDSYIKKSREKNAKDNRPALIAGKTSDDGRWKEYARSLVKIVAYEEAIRKCDEQLEDFEKKQQEFETTKAAFEFENLTKAAKSLGIELETLKNQEGVIDFHASIEAGQKLIGVASELNALKDKARGLGIEFDDNVNSEQLEKLIGNYETAKQRARDLAASQSQFLGGLKDEIATMGMSKKELQEHEAAKLGLVDANKKLSASTQELINKYEAADAGNKAKQTLEGLTDQIEKFGKSERELVELDFDKLIQINPNLKDKVENLTELLDKLDVQNATQNAKDMLREVNDELERFGKTDEQLKELAISKLLAKLPKDAEEAKEAIAILNEVTAKSAELNKNKVDKQATDMLKDLTDQIAKFGKTERELREIAINELVGATPEAIAKLREASAEMEKLRKQQDAKELNKQHETPDAKYQREEKNLNDMKSWLDAGVYEKALQNLRSEHQKLKAEAGDTWAIIGSTIKHHSQQATDALVGWINNVNGLGYSWKSLGDTVRQVLSNMLLDMQKMIMQKQVMEPLMNGIAEMNWLNLFNSNPGISPAPAPQPKGYENWTLDVGTSGNDADASVAMSETAAILTSTLNPALVAVDTNFNALVTTGITPTQTALNTLAGVLPITNFNVEALGVFSEFSSTALFDLQGAARSAAMALRNVGSDAGGGNTDNPWAGIANIFSFPGYASGGTVLSGSTYLVGERGPEIFTAPATGSIIPNHAIRRGSGGGSDVNVTIVQNIQSGGSDTKVSGGQSQIWGGLAKQIEGMVKETIAKEKRLGNSLNPVFAR